MTDLASVVAEIEAERRRQIETEGWTPRHDDEHSEGDLAQAAACYARSAANPGLYHRANVPTGWPWDAFWWKPTDQRRDLIKAAALIVAEIERLDRARVSS
jgi:hypothetical protein